jgi:uncharacterized protein (TIGR03083 family)
VTREGVASARLSSTQLDSIIGLLDDEQWNAPSACAGWRVVDVVAHLAALAHEAVDPPAPDPSLPKVRERYHDLRVDQRRGWSHTDVVDEWRSYTPRQLELPLHRLERDDRGYHDRRLNVNWDRAFHQNRRTTRGR